MFQCLNLYMGYIFPMHTARSAALFLMMHTLITRVFKDGLLVLPGHILWKNVLMCRLCLL